MKIKKVRDRKQEKELYQAGWLLFLVFFILASAWKLFGISMKLPPCLFHKWTGFTVRDVGEPGLFENCCKDM